MHNTDTRIAQHLSGSDDGYNWIRPDNRVDFPARFRALDEYMNQCVHPEVNTGAASAGSGWLTDHGAGHVSTVIRRIEDLTFNNEKCVLSPYEAYLVLVAAHVHDVGNVFGREQHEKRAKDVLFHLGANCVGDDTIEKRMIYDIAMSHGGVILEESSRDTIGRLKHNRRVKRLAAILRFADELSDDHTRTSRFTIGTVGEVSPGSSVFHLYADRLRRLRISHESSSVELTFELLLEHIAKAYRKGSKCVFLLDEIMHRTLKTHREQVYCNRFMSPHILTERTAVTILVCTDGYKDVVGQIGYVLEQTGYPESIDDIGRLAPELKQFSGASAARQVRSVFRSSGANDHSRDLLPLLRGAC